MLDADADAIITLVQRNHKLLLGRRYMVHSPSEVELQIVRAHFGESAWQVRRDEWDLMGPAPPSARMPNLVVFLSNCFMYSTDPERWLQNLAQVADYAVIQDLARCSRAPGRITGPGDGDCQRYSVSSVGVVGITDPDVRPVFDFSGCGAKVIDCVPYFTMPDGQKGKFVVLLDLRPLRVEKKT